MNKNITKIILTIFVVYVINKIRPVQLTEEDKRGFLDNPYHSENGEEMRRIYALGSYLFSFIPVFLYFSLAMEANNIFCYIYAGLEILEEILDYSMDWIILFNNDWETIWDKVMNKTQKTKVQKFMYLFGNGVFLVNVLQNIKL